MIKPTAKNSAVFKNERDEDDIFKIFKRLYLFYHFFDIVFREGVLKLKNAYLAILLADFYVINQKRDANILSVRASVKVGKDYAFKLGIVALSK